MTSDELIAALRVQYAAAAGWILLPQVREGTGWQGNRTADALAFNSWPSRGLELHGFELKTYRGDWQRELKQPAKADGIFAFCDRWFIVTPLMSKPIIRDHELPPTWGWLGIGDDGKIYVNRPAPKLDAKALDRVFVAAVLRRVEACETPAAKVAAAAEQARKEGFEAGRKAEATLQAPGRPNRIVQWQIESLEKLEDHAARTLKSIRRELADAKASVGSGPAFTDEDKAATA